MDSTDWEMAWLLVRLVGVIVLSGCAVVLLLGGVEVWRDRRRTRVWPCGQRVLGRGRKARR